MTFPAEFYVHTATVEPYQGENSLGSVYGAAVTVPGFFDTTADLVRSTTSDDVTSAGSVFYCDPSYAANFVPKSRVSSPNLGGDGKATVVKVNSLTSGSLKLPDHVEVTLA